MLVGILRDVPHIDYERSLAWAGEFAAFLFASLSKVSFKDWSLPDELVFVTVSALLRLASLHADYRERALAAIVRFADESVKMLGEENGTRYVYCRY